MQNTKVLLIPLTADDREQFIIDNQWAFKHSALLEFGERDNHLDSEGEIISRQTIEMCMDAANAETYRIVLDGKIVGGAILHSNHQTNENELDAQAVGSHRGHQGSMGVKQDYSYEYKIYVHKNDYDKAVSLIR